jgi:hypothetical protein
MAHTPKSITIGGIATRRVKHLVKKPENWNVDINNKILHEAAYFCENQMQSAGAIAGVDYTLLNCFELGALICIQARLGDIVRKINSISGVVEYEDDCVEDANDITDVEAKPKAKPSFIVGYQ